MGRGEEGTDIDLDVGMSDDGQKQAAERWNGKWIRCSGG